MQNHRFRKWVISVGTYKGRGDSSSEWPSPSWHRNSWKNVKGDAGKQDYVTPWCPKTSSESHDGDINFPAFKTHCVTGILPNWRLVGGPTTIGNPISVVGFEDHCSPLLTLGFQFFIPSPDFCPRWLHEETLIDRPFWALRWETVALETSVRMVPCIRPCRTFCLLRHALKELLLLHVSFALLKFLYLSWSGLIPFYAV